MYKDTAEQIKRLQQTVIDLGRNPKDYRYDRDAHNPWRREGPWVYILCSNNKEAIVDWSDFVKYRLNTITWGPLSSDPKKDYPHATVLGLDDKSQQLSLHQAIMGYVADRVIDHINGDRYDCRRSNLRHVTTAQNNQNRHTHIPSRKKPVSSEYVSLFA